MSNLSDCQQALGVLQEKLILLEESEIAGINAVIEHGGYEGTGEDYSLILKGKDV